MEPFKNYEDLLGWMNKRGRKSGLAMTREYLEAEVEKEAQVLVRIATRTAVDPRSTPMEDMRRDVQLYEECLADAREHYVEEINEMLANGDPEPLNHWTMMTYRRKPVAWAVAKAIYDQHSE